MRGRRFFFQKIPKPFSLHIASPAIESLALRTNRDELKLAAVLDAADSPQSPALSWTTISGPTNAIFSSPDKTNTTAHFPANGIYVLRVTGDDGSFVRSDDVTVSVGDSGVDAPDASRALWLKLDSFSGATAVDSSGNGNHGALSGGATWLPSGGIREGAIELDGTNDEVVVPDSDSLDNTSAFTLAFWFYAKSFPGDSAGLVSKRNNISDNNAYTTYLKVDRHIYIDIDGGNNRFASATLFNAGQWYHVAITFDGAQPGSQRAKLFVNGKLDTTAAESSSSIPNYNSSVRLGNTHPGATNWLNGYLDDVRFYQRALGLEEVATLALTNFAPSLSLAGAPVATNRVPAMLGANLVLGSSGIFPELLWEKISGNGAVTFFDAAALTTSATFGKSGDYTLQLSADDGQIAVAQNLLVTVAPNPNVFEDWAALEFPGETNTFVISASADPDGDRVANFAEFSLGMNPNASDAETFQQDRAGLPVGKFIEVSGTNYFALELKRPTGRIGVSYDVEASEDLATWTTVDETARLDNGNGTETLRFRDEIPVKDSPQRFLRFKLSAQP